MSARDELPMVNRPDPAAVLPDPPAWIHGVAWAADVESKLKHFQKYVRHFIMTRPGAAVWMKMASGKAQPLDSRVLTPTGFFPMGAIAVGDTVLTPTGEQARVNGVYPQGTRPVYELTLIDRRRVRADAEHIWTVSRKDAGTVQRTTDQLRGELIGADGAPIWSIESITPPDLGTWSCSIDPYLLGVLLAVGDLRASAHDEQVTIGDIDPAVARSLRARLTQDLHLIPIGHPSAGHRFTVAPGHSNPVVDELKRLELYGASYAEKFIPAVLMHSSAGDRQRVLAGLLDTQARAGHATDGDLLVRSPRMANDLCALVHSLGGTAEIKPPYTLGGIYGDNIYHRVTVKLPPTRSATATSRRSMLTGLRRPPTHAPVKPASIALGITDIEYVGEQPTQCISVDHRDHEYVTDGFVRTHNTLTTLSALSLMGEPGHILVVAPRNIAIDTWPQEIFDWGFPLRVTSLNITAPGQLGKNGKPLAKQRDLKTSEFNTLIDSVPAAAAGLYTIGTDRFTSLVDRLSTGGPPRTRLCGVAHPDGDFDLDAARDLFIPLIESFERDNLAAKAYPKALDKKLAAGTITEKQYEQALLEAPTLWPTPILAALRATQITALKPATTTGKPPMVVFSHADADAARKLRNHPIGEVIADRLAEFAGQDLRVAVQIATVDHTQWPFTVLVLDEAQGFKNKTSLRWVAMKHVAPLTNRIIELSGTPAPEGLHELWAQLTLLPGGTDALGADYEQHLRDYFTVDQMIDGRPVSWKISDSSRDALYAKIQHLAIAAENTELKLPGFAPTTHHRVEMDPDIADGYRAFKKATIIDIVSLAFVEFCENERARLLAAGKTAAAAQEHVDSIELTDQMVHSIEAVNGGVLRGKLLQYASGAMYIDIDAAHPDYAAATAHTRRPIRRIHNEKLDQLEKIIAEHTADPDPGRGAILLAYRFDFEKALILDRLADMGIIGAMAYNGMPDTRMAWNRREIPVLLIHPASAGHGLNLQRGGHRLIWYTLPESNEHFQQTPARLNRNGQDRPVRVDVLITGGTVEEKLPLALADKESSQQRLFEATKAEFDDITITIDDLER